MTLRTRPRTTSRTPPPAPDAAPRRPRPALRPGCAALVAFLAALPLDARAQAPADTFRLPELVVTATRVPLHRDALPTPVTVLTRAEIEARGVRSVAEALRTVPGAAIARPGAEGAQTSLFLRGGESDYVKVLIDGVPLNDAGGAVDLADLTLDRVERIEVVRGPASVLYGSDAVAGVIQIFTRRPARATTLETTATGGFGARRQAAGTYGIGEIDATLTGAAGPVGYAVGGGRSWSAGMYPFNSARGIGSATVRLEFAPRPGTGAAGFVRYTDSRSRFPTDDAGALVDANAYLDRALLTAGIDLGHRLTERVDARLHVGVADRDQTSDDRPDGPADTLGVYASRLASWLTRRTADLRVDVDLDIAIATLGAAIDHAEGGFAYDSESEFGPFDAAADYGRESRGYYAQLLAHPARRLHVTAGARIEDHDVFGSFDTYRAGLSWAPLPSTRLRAAFGTAFREPGFAESFGSGYGDRGNPDLVPERSRSWEAGIEQAFGRAARLSATWFDQTFRDLVQFTAAAPGPEAPNYFNVGAAAARGLELAGELARGPLTLDASYTWLRATVLDPGLATDAGFVEGEPLLRRPAHAGRLGVRVAGATGALGLTVDLVGGRDDLDFAAGFPAPRRRLAPYATLDLAAERPVRIAGTTAHVLLRVENLLDARYESTSGFPGTGRVVRLGVRTRLGL